MRKLLLLGFLLSFISVKAQVTFPTNGVKDERPDIYAFTNATLHVDYQTVIENATLLIKEDRVVASGTSVSIPQGTTQIDLKGKHIYPSFIELSSKIGIT